VEDVAISENWPDGGRKRTIKAPRAEYLDGQWWLFNPVTFHFDSGGREIPSPAPELDRLNLRYYPEFNEKPRDFLLQNRNPEYYSTRDRMRFMETHPDMAKKFRMEMECELWSQIAAPLACIVITLFAIPAGVATGRQSVFKGIVAALAMFFAFYALTVGCMVFSRIGYMNAVVAAFLPDAVFIAIGIYLFRRQR
jgi:lipopolysaccharide export LptBFGC system permease protein LptF